MEGGTDHTIILLKNDIENHDYKNKNNKNNVVVDDVNNDDDDDDDDINNKNKSSKSLSKSSSSPSSPSSSSSSLSSSSKVMILAICALGAIYGLSCIRKQLANETLLNEGTDVITNKHTTSLSPASILLQDDEDDDFRSSVTVVAEEEAEEENTNNIMMQKGKTTSTTTAAATTSIGDENRNHHIPMQHDKFHLPMIQNQHENSSSSSSTSSTSSSYVKILRNDAIFATHSNGSPYVLESHKLIFFTVQKTGCTVWKQLFRRMLGYDDWRTGRTFPSEEAGLRQLHMYNRTYATEILNSPDWTKAIWVRDPKQRLLSAYFDKMVHQDIVHKRCCEQVYKRNKKDKKKRKNNNRNKNNDEEKEKKTMTRRQCYKIPHTFDGFIDIISFCNDTHWAPISRRMEEKYYPLIDFVGHTETAYDDAKTLLRYVGAWDEYGKSGWGLYGNESIFESTSFVKHRTSIDAMESAKRTKEYYTKEIEAKLADRFEKDYSISIYNFTWVGSPV